jgi:hypothetical protein
LRAGVSGEETNACSRCANARSKDKKNSIETSAWGNILLGENQKEYGKMRGMCKIVRVWFSAVETSLLARLVMGLGCWEK